MRALGAPLWAWIWIVIQGLWSLLSVAAVLQLQRERDAAREGNREERWQLHNARERLERLRLKGILTPETRLPLSERRGEPMPKPARAPATPDEAARLMATLWDVLRLVEEGARHKVLRARLRETLGQDDLEPQQRPALLGAEPAQDRR